MVNSGQAIGQQPGLAASGSRGRARVRLGTGCKFWRAAVKGRAGGIRGGFLRMGHGSRSLAMSRFRVAVLAATLVVCFGTLFLVAIPGFGSKGMMGATRLPLPALQPSVGTSLSPSPTPLPTAVGIGPSLPPSALRPNVSAMTTSGPTTNSTNSPSPSASPTPSSMVWSGSTAAGGWSMRQKIHFLQMEKQETYSPITCMKHCGCTGWWQTNWEPSFSCAMKQRFGIGPSRRWACDPARLLHENCLVYSLGSAGALEESLHRDFGCDVHVFGEKTRGPEWATWHKTTLSTVDSKAGSTLGSIMRDLGHIGRVVDVLQVDCGACVWQSFSAWLTPGVKIQQILATLPCASGGPEFGEKASKLFHKLRDAGYAVFSKDPELEHSGGKTMRYAWVHVPDIAGVAGLAEVAVEARSAALRDSQFLIDDAFANWQIRKALHQQQTERQHSYHGTDMRAWYGANWEPTFSCAYEVRFGAPGDGGKWLCDPWVLSKAAESGGPCLVYSIGSNGMFDFEEAVHNEISENCEIHTFDFHPLDSYKNLNKGKGMPAYVNYHEVGLAATDGVGEFHDTKFPAKTIHTIVQELGHVGRTVDLFKIDCEGCEWSTVSAAQRAMRDSRQRYSGSTRVQVTSRRHLRTRSSRTP